MGAAMARKKISQRDAIALQKRVSALEAMQNAQRSAWVCDYPGGTRIGTLRIERDYTAGRIEAARMLGHAVVVTERNNGELQLYALPIKALS